MLMNCHQCRSAKENKTKSPLRNLASYLALPQLFSLFLRIEAIAKKLSELGRKE